MILRMISSFLIKAIAQASPNYAMIVFKFPVAFCKELNSIVASSWGSNVAKVGTSVGLNGIIFTLQKKMEALD